MVTTFAEPGRNILPKGSDVTSGKCIAQKGRRLTPGLVGLLAASGHNRVSISPNPTVAIIATGDEVVAPGKPLPEGKLYASNMTTLASLVPTIRHGHPDGYRKRRPRRDLSGSRYHVEGDRCHYYQRRGLDR